MKVITEETIREKFTSLYWGTDNCDQLLEKLLAECKEIGTLEVSKLRPMSEAPVIPEGELQVFVLVYLDHTEVPVIVSFDITGKWPHSAYHGIGWITMPVYKPEEPSKEMIWPNACG